MPNDPVTPEQAAADLARADAEDGPLLRWLLDVAHHQLLCIAWGVSNEATLIGPDEPDRVRRTLRAAMREYSREDAPRKSHGVR